MSSFDPKVPVTGWLLRRGLDGFVAKLTHGLADRATSRAVGRPASAWHGV